MTTIKNVLFIIGLIFLCITVLRLLLGNYLVWKSKQPLYMKIWNVIESVGVCIVLTILIINYYE